MFVRRKHYEQLVRDAAASQERERLVQLLAEQVEYLRLIAHHSTAPLPTIASSDPTTLNFDSGISLEDQPWVGEEEEDLLAMRQANVISEPEFQAALTAARQREHIIE
jgi:hypothetical protein